MTDTNNQEYLTKEKFEEIKEELQELKTTSRKEIAEQLEYAKSLGDLSENAEYHEAREAQANLEDRITRLDQLLKNATIVSSHNTKTVDVGNDVDVRKKGAQTILTFHIVGAEEADIKEKKISTDSPFGSAILGKTKGDTFSFSTADGEMTYTVEDIR